MAIFNWLYHSQLKVCYEIRALDVKYYEPNAICRQELIELSWPWQRCMASARRNFMIQPSMISYDDSLTHTHMLASTVTHNQVHKTNLFVSNVIYNSGPTFCLKCICIFYLGKFMAVGSMFSCIQPHSFLFFVCLHYRHISQSSKNSLASVVNLYACGCVGAVARDSNIDLNKVARILCEWACCVVNPFRLYCYLLRPGSCLNRTTFIKP